MGKKKCLPFKLRQFYKGVKKTPAKEADNEEMEIISRALEDCVPLRTKNTFKTNWNGEEFEIRLVLGLSASLRHLKRNQTKALIMDDTADPHLKNIVAELASKLGASMIIANKMIHMAPKFKLKTLLLVSLVDEKLLQGESMSICKDKGPKPKQIQYCAAIESFNKLVDLLNSKSANSVKEDPYEFKDPDIVQVKCSEKSKQKKEKKRSQKAIKTAATNEEHVV
jgi:hypothetical protein